MEQYEGSVRHPEVGSRVKCAVVKSSFAEALVTILEVDGVPAAVNYRATIRGNGVGEEVYVCDKFKTGDVVECSVLSYGENTIFVSPV